MAKDAEDDTWFDERRGRVVRADWRGAGGKVARSARDAFSWREATDGEPRTSPRWLAPVLAFAITFFLGMVWVLA